MKEETSEEENDEIEEGEKKVINRIPFTEELQESLFSFFQIVSDKLFELESRIELLEKDKK
jgi:hypothetical protein